MRRLVTCNSVSKNGLTVLAALMAVALVVSGCAPSVPATNSKPAAARNSATSTAKPTTSSSAIATSKPASPAASASPATSPAKPAEPRPTTMKLPKPIAKIAPPKKAGTLRGPRTLPVPMLMYHAIDKAPTNAPFPDLYVTPAEFVAQLNYLTKNGYHAVTMQQVYDFWHGKGTLPTKPIVLTFDDGFTGDFETAAPLLKSVNWPATLFLIVGRTKPRMPAEMVRAMIGAGWELGSHTITHEELPSESAAKMKYDITESRKVLSRRFGVPVNFFCYPSGKFDAHTVAGVENAGYLLATTTRGGFARPSEPYELRRVRVSGGESLKAFAASITR
jgi:peptidoglycan/xylan/chitin deacetylase (PgdA/CDA1 family)